jgi:glutamate N-acetyltransferase/amino-acid N-acetyltransferase
LRLPLGYRYSATYAGIRKEKRDDLGLIVSDAPASAAAMFTRNRVQAAPVRLAREHLHATGGIARAILVNAGNANCATRSQERVAQACCRALARALRAPVEQVLPASTGVIGVELDHRLIVRALPRLVQGLSAGRFQQVSRAILTTDRVPKAAFGEVPLRRGTIHIAGMTKGAGMIHPAMATTLAFVMTDAAVPPARLRRSLAAAMERSYHRLSVDGDTSTNDTVVLLANGAAGVRPSGKECLVFDEVLCTIRVTGARDDDQAARIARAIANSPLVKTAIAGSDPNWGRILSAAGNAGVEFDPAGVDVFVQGVQVCRSGVAARFSEHDLKHRLDASECAIRFAIRGAGEGQARFWTCDLTEKYIQINASYRT